MMDKIHIFGASGSGATTLGRALSRELPHVHFDGDDYFWQEKFTIQREPAERIRLLREDLEQQSKWIISGAVARWGDDLKSTFDLVIFLYVPQEIRLQRLRNRELERYGNEILPGGKMYTESQKFLEWASRYDTAGMEMRSKVLHEHWLSDLTCPVLRIEGEQTVDERTALVMDFLKSI